MKYVLILTSLLFISCGKKHYTQVIENKFDNTNNENRLAYIEAKNLLLESKSLYHEQRINELSVAINELQNNETELNDKINFINYQYNILDNVLDNLILTVENNAQKIQTIKVCSSNEYLIKINNDFFAVYMVSNSYGTFLGKLMSNTMYMTTDGNNKQFKIINNALQCF